MDGAKKIRIFNEDIAVGARIFTINGFSAHAGQDQLLDWLADFKTDSLQVFLVHGEFSAQEHLAGLIREKFGFPVTIPEYLEEIILKAGAPAEEIKPAAVAAGPVRLDRLIADMQNELEDVGGRMDDLRRLPADQQARIAELLRRAAADIGEIRDRS